MALTLSQEIDKFIKELTDWRGKWIKQFRELILKTAPEVTWKDVEDRRKEYLQSDENRLVLDTSSNIENNLDEVLEYISNQGELT